MKRGVSSPLCVISLYPLVFAQFGEVCLLTAYGSDDDRLAQRALVASDIARIMDRFSILIVERKHVDRDNIDSTAVVSNEELKKIDAPEELTDLVASRGSRR